MTAQTIANGIILAVIELALLAGILAVILAVIGWVVACLMGTANATAGALGIDSGRELFGTIVVGAFIGAAWVGAWHAPGWIPLAGAVTMIAPVVFLVVWWWRRRRSRALAYLVLVSVGGIIGGVIVASYVLPPSPKMSLSTPDLWDLWMQFQRGQQTRRDTATSPGPPGEWRLVQGDESQPQKKPLRYKLVGTQSPFRLMAESGNWEIIERAEESRIVCTDEDPMPMYRSSSVALRESPTIPTHAS